MKRIANGWKWLIWLMLVIGMSVFLGNQLFVQAQKPDFLIGQTSHGHYQIELACTSCHTSEFGGQEVLQEACVSCHGEELKLAQDSHPKSKFTDPRNADRLDKVDARYCVSCHTEHNPEITHPMGVSLPEDFCFHCHQDIADDRPSHQGMGFETCASAGCHNFHDNRALYEDFLVKHGNGDWLKADARVPDSDVLAYVKSFAELPESAPANELPALEAQQTNAIHHDWLNSAHGSANVGCNSCHGAADQWQAKPNEETCQQCHGLQVETFKQGKHGMRLAQGLSAMSPALADLQVSGLAFHEHSQDKSLTCSTCHNPHSVNPVEAAVSACTSCHNDDHTNGFAASPHGQLWLQFEAGQLPKSETVSCATCHMPKQEFEQFGQTHILVQHNQNDVLRPNEKMIRPVCMNCHSLAFSIDALADPTLIQNNFNGRPSQHIRSIDMSLERSK